eukprot:TCALIF_12238-PA protein Name:"Protein of unknown function" AED:0.02 eAED:0.02 QI:0/0.75/0.6/0.8/0.75/0.8/5/551/143
MNWSSILTLVYSTGEGSSVVPWQAQKASVPVGIILGVILIVLLIGCIIADVICCKVNQAGVTYLISERALRASKAKKRNSQKRVPPVVCTEKRVPPGIKEKQEIIGTQENDPLLLEGSKRNMIVAMSKNGNGTHVRVSQDVAV